VLREEAGRLRRDGVDADEFERAVTMVRSSVVLGLESPLNRMLRLARTQLLLGRYLTVDETLAAYGRLTLDEVNGLVEQVLGGGTYHAGGVGPIAPEEFSGLVASLAG
jgi:predicted Zn-dependent peptidase